MRRTRLIGWANRLDDGAVEALQLENAISPLGHSLLFSRLAFTQAQLGQEREALASLDVARTFLPDHPEDDPNSILYSQGSPSLALGRTYFELSKPHDPNELADKAYLERAWAALTQSQNTISERIRVEVANHQAATALAQRDLEKFRHYFLEGVRGAQALNSQKRKQEAVENWKAAKNVWGNEPQILELAEELMDH